MSEGKMEKGWKECGKYLDRRNSSAKPCGKRWEPDTLEVLPWFPEHPPKVTVGFDDTVIYVNIL